MELYISIHPTHAGLWVKGFPFFYNFLKPDAVEKCLNQISESKQNFHLLNYWCLLKIPTIPWKFFIKTKFNIPCFNYNCLWNRQGLKPFCTFIEKRSQANVFVFVPRTLKEHFLCFWFCSRNKNENNIKTFSDKIKNLRL